MMQHGLSGRGRRPDKRRCAVRQSGGTRPGPRGRVVWFAWLAAHPIPGPCLGGVQPRNIRTPIIGRQDLLPDAPRCSRPVASSAGTKRRLFILFVAFDACRETALQTQRCGGLIRGSVEEESWRSRGLICDFLKCVFLKWTLEARNFVLILHRPMGTTDPHSMCGPTHRTG